MPNWRHILIAAALATIAAALPACDDAGDMRDQARFDPLEPTRFFQDGTSARQLPEGAVAAGNIEDMRRWRAQGELDPAPDSAAAAPAPAPPTMELLQRGQSRFNIWCATCHGHAGYGDGMIVRRGYPNATSFHTDRLRTAPDAYFEQVITHGLGKMPPYGEFVSASDRHAIIAYIRALQLSQHAPAALMPDAAPTPRAPTP